MTRRNRLDHAVITAILIVLAIILGACLIRRPETTALPVKQALTPVPPSEPTPVPPSEPTPVPPSEPTLAPPSEPTLAPPSEPTLAPPAPTNVGQVIEVQVEAVVAEPVYYPRRRGLFRRR